MLTLGTAALNPQERGRLSLTTLRDLERTLEAARSEPPGERALLCFSYEQAEGQQNNAIAFLLEKLAEGAQLGALGSGLIALSGKNVLCVPGDDMAGAALNFARLVRMCIQVVHHDPAAADGTLSIGVVLLNGQHAKGPTLIRRAVRACATARQRGRSTIEICLL